MEQEERKREDKFHNTEAHLRKPDDSYDRMEQEALEAERAKHKQQARELSRVKQLALDHHTAKPHVEPEVSAIEKRAAHLEGKCAGA